MSDSSDSTAPLTDRDLREMGVDPSAKNAAQFWILAGVLLSALAKRARRLYRRLMASPTARKVMAAGVFLTLVAIAVLSMRGAPTDPPTETSSAATDQLTAKEGENWPSIAKANGIKDWHDLVDANIALARENTAWCKARVVHGKPISKAYLTGFLEDGKTPRKSDFCQIFPYKGEELAITTLRVGQAYNLPAEEDATISDNE